MHEQDKARFDKEVDQLRTVGYFINSEGVKSTDLERKLSKRERVAAAEKAKLEKKGKTQTQAEA